ncbi:MAG TPA: type VI secretion system tube protein Hcp [Burkholderiaceae bacterium]|nr:type VI secretion system tube protein Hcp [Burkholderiaceae bacterium]
MSFDHDGFLDPDEVLRLDELALTNMADGMDLAMVVESGGAPVEGESTRSYHDGKPHLNLLGYWVYTKQVQQGSNQKYKAASTGLYVLRHADAATGSLYSLLNNGKIDVKATVQVFRSGGQQSASAILPVIEIVASDGRVANIVSYTSPRTHQACELISFAFRKLEIKSAPQQTSGQRGAVRTCTMTQ